MRNGKKFFFWKAILGTVRSRCWSNDEKEVECVQRSMPLFLNMYFRSSGFTRWDRRRCFFCFFVFVELASYAPSRGWHLLLYSYSFATTGLKYFFQGIARWGTCLNGFDFHKHIPHSCQGSMMDSPNQVISLPYISFSLTPSLPLHSLRLPKSPSCQFYLYPTLQSSKSFPIHFNHNHLY